ncbi:30S ribosomal protein S12 methylthiotransferase RimO [Paenibacillus sp. TRM 82003]|uniref:30S ribosomal protein S12 methylthiotransferase RimO n=1 Tax=Kineococcus sp. TRM81007 TaxID=2925831 RepID=UPI001F585A68|nr:30S ribosomal protein S12 methylthiotransferase RimO [Kineococcus sp. TRM81007]MCI2240303.1 30S ribosomal protein S12 methylthiotransferase RimO [Kineococcus sp. TRM81007]MCI3927520.1 30S ribosomal protein S12 methylthiotransferase RimO [Paenibacillus sp. TRM 82003]
MPGTPAQRRSVALVTLGCARNDVDSEELAGRLADAGWDLVDDPDGADVAVVNTCGFVEQAKKDSIDTVLAAADLKDSGRTGAVVAVGCLAERYGKDLAESLSEADAVLGFDSYTDLSSHLEAILHGEKPASHVPRDRRTLLPLAPAERQAARAAVQLPDLPAGLAPASGPRVVRRRLGSGPWAPVKIAAGCDRRCTFCAIPAFRGSFVSRPADEVLAETRWLAEQGVKEVFLVSENTTSYGKDLGDIRALEALLPQVAAVDGIERVRVSYLQPAEVRPGLLDALTGTPGVVPYFDLSFQHSAPAVLRRMRRFGGTDPFLALLEQVRERNPLAGVRSNVIVGFPGETEDDVDELCSFLERARLDVVGVFGYSDEDGTEAAGLDGHLPAEVVAERADRVGRLVEELVAQRAEERLGEVVEVLVESVVDEDGDPHVVGRAAHQGPEVDGETELDLPPGARAAVGDVVRARVTGVSGADLLAEPLVGAGAPVPA